LQNDLDVVLSQHGECVHDAGQRRRRRRSIRVEQSVGEVGFDGIDFIDRHLPEQADDRLALARAFPPVELVGGDRFAGM
jgi:hypothetical protein